MKGGGVDAVALRREGATGRGLWDVRATQEIAGCCSRYSASARALVECLSIRSDKVSSPCNNWFVAKGLSVDPSSRRVSIFIFARKAALPNCCWEEKVST
jgi:hypothetical protein